MRLSTLLLVISSASAFLAPAKHQTSVSSVVSTPTWALSAATKESSTLTEMDLPEKLYSKKTKEVPKVLGGIKIGLRELVVITGASSGLGLATAVSLAKTGKYFIVMAVRDVEKAKKGE